MIEIYSKQDPTLLLHIINKMDRNKARHGLVEPQNFLQVMTLNLQAGQSFQPHIHLWKEINSTKSIAQEAWVVISGHVKANFFDINHKFLCTHELLPGDASITLFGGHSYEVIEDSFVYEFKSGPYFGQEKDKIFINLSDGQS
jgi:hypothetical protein